MTIKVKGNNWLAEIAKVPVTNDKEGNPRASTYIHLSDLDGLNAATANAAIKAQYGAGYCIVHDHGTVLWGYRMNK